MIAYIYQIRNTQTNDIYIGSTRQRNPRSRWITGHLRDLRGGKHHSPILQHAWNKYGFNAFIYEILYQFEYIKEKEIEQKEQEYINQYHPYYNISKKVIRNEDAVLKSIKANSKEYIVTNPVGIELKIVNLNKFCRENDLDNTSMWLVASGRIFNHKGWLCRPTSMSKEDYNQIRKKPTAHRSKNNPFKNQYKIFFSDGQYTMTHDLKFFCQHHNLSYNAAKKSLHKHIPTKYGWKVEYDSSLTELKSLSSRKTHRGAKTWFIKDIESGQIFKITNLKKYCRENNLWNIKKYHKLKGKGKIFFYSSNESFNDLPIIQESLNSKVSKTYLITSPTGERFIIKNMRKFLRDHQMKGRGMYDVSNGKRPHWKKWKAELIPEINGNYGAGK